MAAFVLGAAVFSEGVFDRMPFPTSCRYMAGGDRAIVLNRNVCDYAIEFERDGGNNGSFAPDPTFPSRRVFLAAEAMTNQTFFSSCNKRPVSN